MKRFLCAVFLALFVFVSSPSVASADLINPDYYVKKCPQGLIEVECSYRSEEPFGPKTYDGCVKYENNPDFILLTGSGSSFGGSQKYCIALTSVPNLIVYHIKNLFPLVLLTLLFEIPLFLLMISKTRRALFAVLCANVISIPLLYIATTFLPFSGLFILIIMELLVIIFEAIFIHHLLKEVGLKRIFIYAFIANAVSAVLGSVVLGIISGVVGI